MTAFWTWLKSLPGRAAAQIRETFWALLGLNGDQQRALMTWGMLGAMVAISYGLHVGVDHLVAMFAAGSEAVRQLVVGALSDGLKLGILLVGMLAAGAVLIARGGEMTIKAPGGIEITARGPAATRELAKSADVNAAVQPPSSEGEGRP